MSAPIYISAARLQELKDEHHKLRTETMRECAVQIDEAKQQGDLSENAEYTEAKDRMAFIQTRIAELEHLVSSAQIIQESGRVLTSVHVGSKITVESPMGSRVFHIVGSTEADPAAGKISNESPLGEAFMDHEVGDSVEVKTPVKTTVYTIISIE
jgi:transcription elongation factor GreA